MTTRILTFNPWLYNQLGHSLIYTRATEKAVQFNDWIFFAALPKKCTLENLPKNWEKNVGCPTVRHWFEAIEKRPYRRPKKVVRAKERIYYYYSTLKLLFKHLLKNKSEKKVLFLEAFAQTDLKLLVNLLRFFPKNNLSIWIIHRYQSSTLKSDVARYNTYHKKLLKMGIHLKLLTDSDLLKEDLEPEFNLPMTVLPIHYVKSIDGELSPNKTTLTCWWPGVIREGKGLKIIQDFAASISLSNKKIHLVVNKNSDLKLNPNSPKVTFLENHLSSEDYQAWMQKSDVILLPYLDPHYEKATSSIFIEAILAGKIPLVYPKTWMAYELQKHHLNELIMDWNSDELSEKIVQIQSDLSVIKKLKTMKKAYQSFHTLERYAQILQKLAK